MYLYSYLHAAVHWLKPEIQTVMVIWMDTIVFYGIYIACGCSACENTELANASQWMEDYLDVGCLEKPPYPHLQS